jgi:hypothetical protein
MIPRHSGFHSQTSLIANPLFMVGIGHVTAFGAIAVNSWSFQNYVLGQSFAEQPPAVEDDSTSPQNNAVFTLTAATNGVTASTNYSISWSDSGAVFNASYSLFWPTAVSGPPASLSRIIMTFTTTTDYLFEIIGNFSTQNVSSTDYGASVGSSYLSSGGPFYSDAVSPTASSFAIDSTSGIGSPQTVLPAGSYVYSLDAEMGYNSTTTTFGSGSGATLFELITVPEPGTVWLLAMAGLLARRPRLVR